MADVETIRTMASFVRVLQDLRDDKKLADAIAAIEEQAEAVDAKRKEAADIHQETQRLRAECEGLRNEAQRVNEATNADLSRRETELATAYKFQLERDADLKQREDALAKRAAEVKKKDDAFATRERDVSNRETVVSDGEAKLKARVVAFEKKRAAVRDMAEV